MSYTVVYDVGVKGYIFVHGRDWRLLCQFATWNLAINRLKIVAFTNNCLCISFLKIEALTHKEWTSQCLGQAVAFLFGERSNLTGPNGSQMHVLVRYHHINGQNS